MIAVKIKGKQALTPQGRALEVPTQALAESIEKEAAQKGTKHFTQLAGIAIDIAGEKRDTLTQEILAYGDTDLVCYRAGNIPVLEQRQEEQFSPLIAWAAHRFGVVLSVTDGLMPIMQPKENKDKFLRALAGYDNWQLAALGTCVKPLNSILLALAFIEREIDAKKAFLLCHLEEMYETEQWGEDEEKKAKINVIKEELNSTEQFLLLLH